MQPSYSPEAMDNISLGLRSAAACVCRSRIEWSWDGGEYVFSQTWVIQPSYSLKAMDNISPGLRSAVGGALPREPVHILHIP